MHIHAKSGKGSGMYHKLKVSEQDNRKEISFCNTVCKTQQLIFCLI